ncbi:MAG: thiolase domain-containing protein [Acidimicrobiia bacterium]|nr:MAG: thiolase domain-containing protein [Acidimicrobiia bacterium]
MQSPPVGWSPTASILGAAETEIALEDPRSIPEMVLAAVEGALDDATLGWDDIDAVVTASIDLFDGLTASSIAVTEVVGAVMKPETRIAADGLAAVIHAVHQIVADAYRTVLVVAHGKASMAPLPDLTAWAMDPIYLQPLGVNFLTVAGLQAAILAGTDSGAVPRWAARVAERRSATDGVAGPISAAEVMASPVIASPLRAGMCAPLGDGAGAVVLGIPSEEAEGVVQITGTGHDLEPHRPGDRDLTEWAGLRRACRRAYAAAGIHDPTFSVVEPSCLFPHEEDLFVDASGIGVNATHSPGGGLFTGTAPVVAGLSRLIHAARAIDGHPGHRGLAHGTWGPAGQGHAVVVVEAR